VNEWLTFAQAGAMIDTVALALIGLALIGTIVRRLDLAIWLLATQGVALSLGAGAVALAEGAWRPWAAFMVALLVKAIAIPVILHTLLRRITLRREVETVVPIKLAFPLGIGLVLVAYYALGRVSAGGAGRFDAPNALPAALALQLLGLFVMVTRKKALTQVIGLVTMENGIYLATVAATGSLPFLVEFGVAMDVLTGVAVMGLVIHEINRLFGEINTDRLQALRD
jgi:hydrogenase-4 component E